MMGDRKLPLWQCPECGRQFANKNQWHSCTTMTLEDHLRDKTPLAIELYRGFEAAVRECGPFRIHPVKTRVSFITRMSFAGAELKKRWIDAAFLLPYRSESSRFRKIESYSPKSHGHYLRIHSLDDIDDEVRAWACDAYRVGRQETPE